MIGRQLSRWTMAWFASALAFLVASLCAAVAGAGGPGHWSGGAALAVVHLFALGWLCQMMLGSLIQFTPVLCARPVAVPGLALPALLLTGGGTAMLAAGFLSLDGWAPGQGLLALAPVVLAVAFAMTGAMLAPTLVGTRGLGGAEGRMVALALVALGGLWATGAAMGWALGGYDLLPVALFEALPLHILLGAGGFLTLAAFGVSYKLFAMFLLAPEGNGALRQAVFGTASLALGLTLGLTGLALAGRGSIPLSLLAAFADAAAVALYLAEIRRLWRSRHRPKTEVNMRWSCAALGFLGLSAALLPPAILWGGRWAEAAAFAALAGWLSTLTLAQMVKIVSFLTWIQVFAPRIGRCPVPLVSDLVDARATGRWLGLWVAGAAGGTLALAAAQASGFQLAALAMLAAALGLVREAWAIRRLRHLDPARRPGRLPPLVLPAPPQGPDHDHTRSARA
ncbi:hypothetical protein [Paracoccus benzoatiresistens]|uniref:Uncharacterized protein n=1 Tax=Paracoccus benzoatiresistens TaxID=2997341 RepID=A0ABT4J7R5_9RHOB|nr:hypothetical protein [Paracoccus sp. EF6]MCZ0963133.1 hypothetical protein [Paracoccus sp. EF6]